MSVGLLGAREQGNLRKCSPSALESALRNRGTLGSAPESALEGALPVVLYSEKALKSTLGSTPESTPISESTLESTRGALSEISLFSGSLAGQQTRNPGSSLASFPELLSVTVDFSGCRKRRSAKGIRSLFRTCRIGANPENSDLVNFRCPD